MIYIFVTNNAIGSRLIRWGTRSKVSHMIVARNDKAGSLCVESRGDSGVVRIPLTEALLGNKIVRSFEVRLQKNTVNSMWYNVCALVGKKYDFKAIAFFTVALVVWDRILQIGRPRENKWADKNQYTCSELLLANKNILKFHTRLNNYSDQMISPDIGVTILEDSTSGRIVENTQHMKDLHS